MGERKIREAAVNSFQHITEHAIDLLKGLHVVTTDDLFSVGTIFSHMDSVFVIAGHGNPENMQRALKIVAFLESGTAMDKDLLDSLYNHWLQRGGKNPLSKDQSAAIIFSEALRDA